jgi:hypothetical protein
MRIVELTPPQIVSIFGWFNLQPYLRWEDVEKNPKISFRFLRDVGLTPTQLHTIQPDVQPWKQYASITLHDCLEMTQWPAHPIHTLKADLADIISMRWTADQMMVMGINIDELVQLGMLPDLMTLFAYSLGSWTTLGLTQKHVANMTDTEILRVFGMSRMRVLCGTPKTTESVDSNPQRNVEENVRHPESLIRPVSLNC